MRCGSARGGTPHRRRSGTRPKTGIVSTRKFLQSEERGPGWKPIGGPAARRSTIRVIRTGEEGWIHGNLVQLSSATRLGRETEPAGFKDLSPGFDSLMRTIEERYGYQMVERVEVTEERTLRVVPTREWLVFGGRQDHLLAVLAFYQMWKGNQDDQAVNVSLMDEKGGQYITVSDDSSGPSLRIHSVDED